MVNSTPGSVSTSGSTSVSTSATPVGTDDFVAIQRLVHRYADAVVHRDATQWASCWAADAEWDLGRGRRVTGKAEIVELWTSAMAHMASVVQMVHNGEAWSDERDNDRATGRWYVDEHYRRANGEPGILLAHYDDAYVRTAGAWLFSNRRLQPHYQGPPDLSAEFNAAAVSSGARGELDA